MREFKDLIRQFINEISVERVGGRLRVSAADGEDFIIKPGSMGWEKGIGPGFKCFSVYRVSKRSAEEYDPIELIKLLKDPTGKFADLDLPRGVVEEILDKSIEICMPWISDLGVDVVTTPQSSKTLAVRFGRKIAEALGVEFVAAGTLKDISHARIADLPPSFSEKTAKSLRSSLQRMAANPGGTLHKHFRPQDRKFIRDWQYIRTAGRGEEGHPRPMALRKGAKALLVDDVISDGTTLSEMRRTLEGNGIGVVGCLSLFRTGT